MTDIIRDSLDRSRLIETIEKLVLRISERFPSAGLGAVCRELLAISQSVDEDLAYIARPNWWLRGSVMAFIALVLGLIVYGAVGTKVAVESATLVEFIQIVEAGINDIVLIGAAVIFLVSFEARSKRQRVIAAVNRLRSIAHVIDMHQLTKDPSIEEIGGAPTEHSPERRMTRSDLARYLDYCSEMLSLNSKVAFCYIQEFDDPEAVHAVNDLETLTNGLSRKVWQKIMLISASAPSSRERNG
jgi:hypothetical protein